MSRLRRLAIVLVAIGLVTSAVYATGAFSSLSTSRDANVQVAGDKAGYLGLAPGENGEYTTYQNGKLQLQLNGALGGEDAPRGGGVNREAETAITSVFTITNQGAQSVGVWLADTDDHIAFEHAGGGSLEGKGNAVQLAPGDTVHVGLTIDTTDTGADQLDTQLIINADSDVEGVSDGTEANTGGPGDHAPPPEEETENADGDGEQEGADEEQTDSDADEEATVTIEGITLRESDANAFVDGMIYGDRGLSDGADPQDSASSPFYVLGQLALGFVPGLGDLADVRDAHQQVKNEKYGEAAVSSLAALPVIGSYFDGAKATNFAKIWIKRFPSKGGDIASLLAKHVAPHMPEKLTIELIDIFTDGKASNLKDQGKSVDTIIERTKKGTLDENPNDGKRVVTDGGRSTAEVKQTIGNKRYVDDDLTDANYRHIEEEGNVDETMMAVSPSQKSEDGDNVAWLEKGTNEVGWEHLSKRHIKGTYKIDEREATSLFPVGQTVKGTKLPNTLSENEVKRMIYDAVKKGESTPYGEKTKYYFEPSKQGYSDSGVDKMTVIVEPNGKIETAFPRSGPAVKKWVSGLNGGQGGFVETA